MEVEIMPTGKRARSHGASGARKRGFPYPGYNAERRKYPAAGFMRQYHARDATTRASYGASRSAATAEQLARRDADRVYGRGRYSIGKNWRKFSQALGLAGAGRRLVGGVTDTAMSMIGQGAYARNSLVDTDMSAVPQFATSGDETGAVRITRREYIEDIIPTSADFVNFVYPINPGLEGTFPWLSQVAANYEEYDLEQCMFTFRSTTTEQSGGTPQCGTVIMATNYNAGAAPFADKAVMMEYDGAMSAKTVSDMVHGVECDDAKRSGSDAHYVRNQPVVVGQDIKSYDHGIFQLAVSNTPASYQNISIGELWVSYTVVLRKPKFYTARALGLQQDIFVSGNPTESAVRPFGSSGSLLSGQQNGIGGIMVLNTDNVIVYQFPREFTGYVELKLCMEGLTTTAASVLAGISVTGNLSFVADLFAAGAAGDSPSSQVTAGVSGLGHQIAIVHVYVKPQIGATQNTVRWDIAVGAITGAPTQSSLTVSEYNAGFSTRAMAIGPAASRTDAPVLVNPAGAVVIPA